MRYACVERTPGAARAAAGIERSPAPVLLEPRLQRRELGLREGGGVAAEEQLEQGQVAELDQVVGRRGRPRPEGLAAALRQRVAPPAAAALLLLLGEVARLGEPGGLRVELRVRQRPEVPDAAVQRLLQPVGVGLAQQLDEPEDDVRRGRQVDFGHRRPHTTG
jgi:hypothetical protein